VCGIAVKTDPFLGAFHPEFKTKEERKTQRERWMKKGFREWKK
jgi:hypothetical protein